MPKTLADAQTVDVDVKEDASKQSRWFESAGKVVWTKDNPRTSSFWHTPFVKSKSRCFGADCPKR